MIIEGGDVWKMWENSKHGNKAWIAVTTNGVIKSSNGCAVMGRGIALQAAKRFPELPRAVGEYISVAGNNVGWFNEYRVVTLPTKHHWRYPSDIKLIERSLIDLSIAFSADSTLHCYLPMPGCGCGQLNPDDVMPVLEKHLNNQFSLVLSS